MHYKRINLVYKYIYMYITRKYYSETLKEKPMIN